MRISKLTMTKAIALILSMTLLLTCAPAPIYAESPDMPLDTVVEVADETPVEEETGVEDKLPSEEAPTEQEQPAIQPEDEQPDEDEQPSEEFPADPVPPPVEDEPAPEPEVTPEEDADDSFPEDIPADDEPVGDDPTADSDSPEDLEETDEPADDQPVIDDSHDTEAPDDPLPELPEPSDEVVEDEQPEDTPVDETEDVFDEEPAEYVHPVKAAVEADGYAYLMTNYIVQVYRSSDMWEHIFTVAPNEILLVTAFIEQDGVNVLEAQYLTAYGEVQTAYAYANDLPETLLTSADVDAIAFDLNFALTHVSSGEVAVYAVDGQYPDHAAEEIPPVVEQPPVEVPTQLDWTDEQPADVPVLEDEPVIEDEQPIVDDPVEDEALAVAGDFVGVSLGTRVFLGPDDSASDAYMGDLSLGYFVKDGTVQIESIEQDSLGRAWYKVCFMYGDDFADGTLKWTEYESVYVLASETFPTWDQHFTLTDYAFPQMGAMMLSAAEEPSGFSLKSISGPTGSFYVGQSGLHGSSGRDAEYKQIATLDGRGKIYATPHFLEGYVVYCLEHTLPGPGENISGGGKQPTGPYLIVDWESYQITDGYSGTIYGEDTMHAIAWVLAHTYPFMVLDRSDSDNETWSRVAGQFAIREVIKQMEGSQYVRDYWRMDEFYAATNNAPAVYLEYARWLASNAIAHANRTGEIIVSNKTVGVTVSGYYGTATLTTDVDYMRIAKGAATITGHTGGEDNTYYYLNSGDTITIYSSSNSFSVKVESMSDDEADFLVGVPSVAIQKVLIPIEGIPYPSKDVTLNYRIEHGAILVAKTDADSGMTLPGATFALLDATGTVLQTATTDGSGTVTFSTLNAGQYQVQEIGAPTGYLLSVPSTQPVTVTAGATSQVVFANDRITSRIRIFKTDAQSGTALAGAVFTITDVNNTVVATLTTGADGTAITGWLPYGTYTVTETAAPDHYINSGFSTTVNAYEDGKTYAIDVSNEPMRGGIRLTKTDAVTGKPIAGVVFDIYLGSTLVGSMQTNANGVAVSGDLEPGNYTVRERALPTGYAGGLVSLDALVEANATAELSCTNTPSLSRVKIVKKDANTSALLAGATFTVTNASGVTVATLTTGADGTAVTDWLPYGTYTVTETAAPDHYINEGFSQTFDAHEDGKTYTFEVTNTAIQGGIHLTKTDVVTGKPIAGVTFDIYQGNTLICSMTTNSAGVAVSESLEPGSYTVKERALPNGYTGDLVTLDALVQSESTTELTCTNMPIQGKAKIIKTNALTGALLAGATFTVTDAAGITVATLTTDTDGTAETGWLMFGTYTVAEVAAPENFINAGFSQTFDVAEDGKTYTFEVANIPMQGGIKLVKTDAISGKPIAGVTFDIYLGSTLVGSMTTNGNGIAVSEALDPGSYTVRERELPLGYVGELVELDVQVASQVTAEVSATNMPSQSKVRIVKTDSLTHQPLAGATFTITDESGALAATLTTGADGTTTSDWLPYSDCNISTKSYCCVIV